MSGVLLFYPYLRHFLWDSINNNHDQQGGTGEDEFPQTLRSVQTAFEALNSLGMLRKSYFCQVSLVQST